VPPKQPQSDCNLYYRPMHYEFKMTRIPSPFLPPFGHHVLGNKLYLVDSLGKVTSLPANNNRYNNSRWTDSVFVNARLWKMMPSNGRSHRLKDILFQLTQKDGSCIIVIERGSKQIRFLCFQQVRHHTPYTHRMELFLYETIRSDAVFAQRRWCFF
jgi:hypothetical protein